MVALKPIASCPQSPSDVTREVRVRPLSWMSRDGGRKRDIDILLERPEALTKGTFEYKNRNAWLRQAQRRLLLVKAELDLIPRAERQKVLEDEDTSSETSTTRARREEEAEALRRAEEEEEQRQEKMKREQAEAEAAARLAVETAVLESVARTPQELAQAVTTLTGAMRCLLLRQNAGYVSYVDASTHTSLAALEQYNAMHAGDRTTTTTTTAAEDFSTEPLHAALHTYNQARQRLDQHRARSDATYSTRLRSRERAAVTETQATGTTEGEEEDETALLTSVQVAHNSLTEARLAYNARALKSATAPPPAPVQASAPADVHSIETPATPATQEQ